MYRLFLSLSLLVSVMLCNAQKNNFGVISYTAPAGYELIKNDKVLTYYKEDKSTGAYCNFFIYDLIPGKGGVQQDFDFAWNNLVQKPFKFISNPTLQPAATLKGWQLQMGSTKYADNGVATLAILITFSSGSNMQNICMLSNSDKYKTDIERFIASVDLAQEITSAATTQQANTGSAGTEADNSLVGTWTFNEVQSTGSNATAMILLSSETEYQFKSDGTYAFLKKLNVKGTKKISFAYETGKWSVTGNRLTIAPAKGQNEEWSASEATKSFYSSKLPGWGSKLKTTPRKLESITYLFEKKTLPAGNFKSLLLQYDTPTERDGKHNYDPANHLWRYSPQDPYPDIVPPGFMPDLSTKATDSKPVGQKTNTTGNINYNVWMNYGYSVNGNMADMKFKTVVISADGRCLFYMPETGLNGITPQNSNQTGSWGKVTDKGTMLSLVNEKYGNMELYKISAGSMSRYPDKKTTIYKKVNSVDGLRLEGAYSPELSYYNGKTDIISRQTDPYKRPILFFKRDGTYINEGLSFSNLTFGDDYAIGKGTYEIINYSLILTTQSGKKLQIAFLPVLDANAAAPDNGGLIINNSLFYRLNKTFVPHN